MKFRPCIDLHEGIVKQIVGESLGEEIETNFSTEVSAVNFAKTFSGYNLSGGHICLLDKNPNTKTQALSVLKSFPNIWQVGGGITKKNAQEFIDAGADKVIITSALFEHDNIYQTAQILSKKISRSRLVFDLSCDNLGGKYWFMKNHWQTKSDFEFNLESLIKLSSFASEFLIHGVAVEGKMAGFDEKLVGILGRFKALQPSFPVTYAGGIASVDQIKSFAALSDYKIDFTIGSALEMYGGKLSLQKIISLQSNIAC